MSATDTNKPFLKALAGERTLHPPIWLMRQAGRYLPEYRELRAKAPSFIDFCLSPDLAIEATLQPIRRFGFDAAILFSDILIVPHALGQGVRFAEGEGPRLDPVTDQAGLDALAGKIDLERVNAVFETVRGVRAALPAQTAMIGFCGAPWTVASYMIAGKGTPDQAPIRLMAYQNPDFLERLIDLLVVSSIDYLAAQVEAGAEVIQIFESFAGALPPALFDRWSLEPISRIAQGLRARHPGVRIIVFARGANLNLVKVAQSSAADAVGLDWGVDLEFARSSLQPLKPVQGNLDPLALIAGGEALDRNVDAICEAFAQGPHVFNLGHGIQPQTPIAHVERLVERVRAFRR